MHLRKLKKMTVAATAALAFAGSACAGSVTFQGVTFEALAQDADTLTLRIRNAISGGIGNWANINYLSAFEIKDIGKVSGAMITGWSGVNGIDVDHGLAANAGCTTGGTPGACFFSTPPMQLTDDVLFTIDFAGIGIHLDLPHLKVQFFENPVQSMATGSLLSMSVPTAPVPEPEVYAMLVAGLGLMGFVARRRKQRD